MLELDDIAEIVVAAVRSATQPLIARIDALEAREMPAPADEEALAERVLKAIPTPEPVEPIAPDMEAIGKFIEDGIAKAVAELPEPEKGDPGIGLTGAMIDREGNLVLTLSNGETRNVGLVVGKDGEPGKDGITPAFIDAEFEGRFLTLSFGDDETRKSVSFKLDTPEYCGAFSESRTYERGDMVSWGGSLWHCDKETSSKPDIGSGDWSLAVKRGRNGKDAA